MLLLRENKFLFVKIRLLILILCILSVLQSCTDNPASTQPPADSTLVYVGVNTHGMQRLRSGEYYVLWVKIAPDTAWARVSALVGYYIHNNGDTINRTFSSPLPLDSIKGALITLERDSTPAKPGIPLLQSLTLTIDSTKKKLAGTFDSKQFLGDYSALEGGLVFTSTLPDSSAYTHEFYLMNLLGTSHIPSLLSLNAPPPGWDYGLWAADTNFTPHEFFFYGLFSSPNGHDNDSANDFYPFPGGWKPQRMDMPGGSIMVTLEPRFYGDSLKYKGPSSFTLLNFDRIRFIEKDKNYPMTNVSGDGIPSGNILFHRN